MLFVYENNQDVFLFEARKLFIIVFFFFLIHDENSILQIYNETKILYLAIFYLFIYIIIMTKN